MSSLLHSVRWAAISQGSRVIGQLVSLAVLSRLLPPTDYGIMAMAGVAVTLAGMLRDMGTGTAIVQRKDLTPSLTDTIFWMNVGMGCLLGLVLALGSGVIGGFFHEARLPGVLLAMAGLFPFGSVTAVHQALIERRSGFKSLAGLDVLNQLSGLVTAIVAAYLGAGVYSLVIPAWVNAIISTVWLMRQSGWKPRWHWSQAEFKGLWAFSGHLTAFNFVNYFARNADSMIIGRMLGSAPLGTYSMGYKLMLFPVQNLSWVMNRVMMPRLSQLQNDVAASREIYFKMLGAIVTLSTPLMAGLWVLRRPFVAFAFGSRWGEVADLLAWLAPIGFLQSMMSTTGPVFISVGKTNVMFKMGALNTAIFVVAFLIGAKFSLIAVAAAYLASNIINWTAWAWITGKQLEARVRDLWAITRAPLLSVAVMIAGMEAVLKAIDGMFTHPVIVVAIGAGVGVAIYLFMFTLVFKQSLKPLIGMVRGK